MSSSIQLDNKFQMMYNVQVIQHPAKNVYTHTTKMALRANIILVVQLVHEYREKYSMYLRLFYIECSKTVMRRDLSVVCTLCLFLLKTAPGGCFEEPRQFYLYLFLHIYSIN